MPSDIFRAASAASVNFQTSKTWGCMSEGMCMPSRKHMFYIFKNAPVPHVDQYNHMCSQTWPCTSNVTTLFCQAYHCASSVWCSSTIQACVLVWRGAFKDATLHSPKKRTCALRGSTPGMFAGINLSCPFKSCCVLRKSSVIQMSRFQTHDMNFRSLTLSCQNHAHMCWHAQRVLWEKWRCISEVKLGLSESIHTSICAFREIRAHDLRNMPLHVWERRWGPLKVHRANHIMIIWSWHTEKTSGNWNPIHRMPLWDKRRHRDRLPVEQQEWRQAGRQRIAGQLSCPTRRRALPKYKIWYCQAGH